MELFVRSDQYNFIKAQTQILINGHSTVNDIEVLHALKSIVQEKVLHLFMDISEEQRQILHPIINIEDNDKAEEFLSHVLPYVIPFKEVTEKTIKKLFPKAKKLKVPILENMNLYEISYLGWNDKGSNKKYIVAHHHNKLIGIQGTYKSINKKGICALCNHHEEIGMFLSEAKGTASGTFIKRGNYICENSQKCNQNIISLDKLNDFIERLTS
ncbi:FusB/FusC family EF-G-binding protein [Peribacillus loiseleuriae]|uniref:FusB/FusC family EF-G-binding protein n=1 Tax=Peribacillus loiseleuriae TaxID=1679170 RepID=UPI0037F231DC